MKKRLAIASVLILVGCIIFIGGMSVLKWDFTKLSTVEYETNSYELEEGYGNISITTDCADIFFLPSENEKSSVVCHEVKNEKHMVRVENDTLVIALEHTRKWYENIEINFGTPTITVYIPSSEYKKLSVKSSTGDIKIPESFKFSGVDIVLSTGDVDFLASVSDSLKIKTTTGNISIANVSCDGEVVLDVSTGDITLNDVECKSLDTKGNTGSLYMKGLLVSDVLRVKRSTGDIKLDSCDAGEIYIETTTGCIKGSVCSEKTFSAVTNTGNATVPKGTKGGICDLKTNTGDIVITVCD